MCPTIAAQRQRVPQRTHLVHHLANEAPGDAADLVAIFAHPRDMGQLGPVVHHRTPQIPNQMVAARLQVQIDALVQCFRSRARLVVVGVVAHPLRDAKHRFFVAACLAQFELLSRHLI
ncbi:MAG: hypothetical protein F4X51_06675 [Gemmatimonadetes bacterium]|nr:hypothetical protein [Gemmatimonadota bacterium]